LEKPDLIVVVQGDEIIVRTLGFRATYHKSIDQPQVVMRDRTKTDDYELLADAWRVAKDKARELGWIASEQPDLNTGKEWSKKDLFSLRNRIEHGRTVAHICAPKTEVREKAAELGIELK
jgi:hypothetical protein